MAVVAAESPREAGQPLLADDAQLAALDDKKKAARHKVVANSPIVMRWLAVVVLCLLYMAVSSGLIVLNKYLMSVDGFHYPLCLSSLGMAFSGVASFIACKVFRVVDGSRLVAVTPRFYLVRIMPVGLFMALTLFLGNLSYLYLSVAYIQMLKAFCPIITMAALFVAQMETPSRRLISSVVAIAVGTAVASYGELNLSYIGLLVMFSSETFESIRLVMTQVLLVGLKFHPMEGLMYLAPACVLWGALGVWIIEWPAISAEGGLALVAAKPMLYASAAAMGFGVNLLAYMVIQMASSLTLKVLGTVKNTVVVWAGILFFRESVTMLQGVGYSISLAGFALYNHHKMAASAAAMKELPSSPTSKARDDVVVLESGLEDTAKLSRRKA